MVLTAIARADTEIRSTTIVITHNSSISGMADRGLRLSHGRIADIERNLPQSKPGGAKLVSLLDRKVLRDLWALRGQVVTIALLVAAGVTVLIGSVSSYVSLVEAAETYYRSSRFADIWADVKRAPRSILPKIEAIPGVGVVEPRIVKDVRINWPQSETAVSGRMISIPDHGQPALNELAIALGRPLDPTKRDEAIINSAFAECGASIWMRQYGFSS